MKSLRRRVDAPVPTDTGDLPILSRRRLPWWVRLVRWWHDRFR